MKKISIILSTAVVLGTASCMFGPFMADLFVPATSSVLNVNTIGAKAVAGILADARSASGVDAKGSDSKALEDNPVLVKFLEDGTIASIFDAGDRTNYIPDIAFLTTGEDGSIYVGFMYPWWIWTGSANESTQFIRIYPESTEFDVLWPPADSIDQYGMSDAGQIYVWGWWGMEQDPLVKGPDGKLYFMVENWNSSSSDHSIYKYDPDSSNPPVMITPDNASLYINTFMVDAKKHLFIQSNGWDNGSASFLRYYTDGGTGYKNVYYSSDQDTWIRSYVPAPSGDFLVINGSNIRGMDGIIKISELDSSELSYDLMYSEANNGGTWINLCNHYESDWENNTEIIDNISSGWDASAYEWRDDVKTSNIVDINKIYTKIQPYFYSVPTVKAGKAVFVTGDLDQADGSSSATTRQLYQWIMNYPEEFLEEFFDGILFKDWLADNGMTDLYFGNVGKMLWASDGSLYGLYDASWWGGAADGTKVIKLLDAYGERDLGIVNLVHGAEKPSQIKVEGDYLYYRYAVLDASDQETGKHQLARMNITSGGETEILPTELNNKIEIVSYDVSSNNAEVYFVGANSQTNEIINGKINIAARTWERIDTTLRFGNIKVIE